MSDYDQFLLQELGKDQRFAAEYIEEIKKECGITAVPCIPFVPAPLEALITVKNLIDFLSYLPPENAIHLNVWDDNVQIKFKVGDQNGRNNKSSSGA